MHVPWFLQARFFPVSVSGRQAYPCCICCVTSAGFAHQLAPSPTQHSVTRTQPTQSSPVAMGCCDPGPHDDPSHVCLRLPEQHPHRGPHDPHPHLLGQKVRPLISTRSHVILHAALAFQNPPVRLCCEAHMPSAALSKLLCPLPPLHAHTRELTHCFLVYACPPLPPPPHPQMRHQPQEAPAAHVPCNSVWRHLHTDRYLHQPGHFRPTGGQVRHQKPGERIWLLHHHTMGRALRYLG